MNWFQNHKIVYTLFIWIKSFLILFVFMFIIPWTFILVDFIFLEQSGEIIQTQKIFSLFTLHVPTAIISTVLSFLIALLIIPYKFSPNNNFYFHWMHKFLYLQGLLSIITLISGAAWSIVTWGASLHLDPKTIALLLSSIVSIYSYFWVHENYKYLSKNDLDSFLIKISLFHFMLPVLRSGFIWNSLHPNLSFYNIIYYEKGLLTFLPIFFILLFLFCWIFSVILDIFFKKNGFLRKNYDYY